MLLGVAPLGFLGKVRAGLGGGALGALFAPGLVTDGTGSTLLVLVGDITVTGPRVGECGFPLDTRMLLRDGGFGMTGGTALLVRDPTEISEEVLELAEPTL